MAHVRFHGNQVSQPEFIKSLGVGREILCEFPARLDPTQFKDDLGTRVALTANAAQAAVTIAFTAIDKVIPAGSILNFGAGKYARTTAEAAAGATTVAVEALPAALATGNAAVYSGNPGRTILAGRLMGRTLTEAANAQPFGKADVANDHEIYLSAFTIDDADVNPDVEFLKANNTVTIALNYLPGYANGELTADEITWIRNHYLCITAHGG